MSQTSGITPVTDKDQEFVVRNAQTAVAAGAVLKYHTDGIKVVELAASDLLTLACGVAAAAAAAGEDVKVVTNGVVNTLVDGTVAVAIGNRMVASTTNAGVLIKDATVAAADVAGNVVPLAAQSTAQVAGTLTMCKVNFR